MDSLFTSLALKYKAMGAVAILKNGQLIYNNAIGYSSISEKEKISATPQTRYRIGSITKMFTAVIIFQLIEEKKLSLDDKLSDYFPSVPNSSKITIDNMLSHRSGIHNFTDDSLYRTYYENPKTQKEMVDIISSAPPDFEPGTKTEYSNSNFVLLGYIAEKISKKTYRNLVKERITDKLRLYDTYVAGKMDLRKNECHSYSFNGDWKQEPETDLSVPAGAGSIVSTAADLARFIESLFKGKLISTGSLDQMKTIKDGLGKGMFVMPFFERKGFGHNGAIDGFGSMLVYYPKDSVAFVCCLNGQVYPINSILIGMLSIYYNYPYTLPDFDAFNLTSADLDQYPGIYSSTQIPLKITITKNNNTLIAQATGQASFPLEPTGKDVFSFERAGVVMEFRPAKKEFTLKQGGVDYLFTRD